MGRGRRNRVRVSTAEAQLRLLRDRPVCMQEEITSGASVSKGFEPKMGENRADGNQYIGDLDRRIGRTTRQLMALPDGSVFVAGFARHARYCLDLLHSLGRAPDAVRVISLAEIDRLRGLPRSTVLDIDHGAFRFMTPQQRDLIRVYQARFTLPPIGGGQ